MREKERSWEKDGGREREGGVWGSETVSERKRHSGIEREKEKR